MCTKFKVDQLSRFCTEACQLFNTQEPFPTKISLDDESSNIKFSLSTFSDQITIYQNPFKIYHVKQIIHLLAQKSTYLNSIWVFPFFNLIFLLK